jgi:hypothetical protein
MAEGRDAARRAELKAAGEVMDLFAREAVLALDRYVESLPPGRPLEAGERFAGLWRESGLHKVEFPNPTDSQRILRAAYGLSQTSSQRPLTVAGATRDASLAGRPVTWGIEHLRRDLEDSYGDSLEVPEPGEWLKQSLGRLAKASVVRDAVQLGAAVRLLSPAAREQADNLVQQGLRLKDARREAGRSADGYRAASDRFTVDSLTYNAVSLAATSIVMAMPHWTRIASVPVNVYAALKVFSSWANTRSATKRLDAGQEQLRSVRADVAGVVDRTKPLGPLAQRAADIANRRSDGPSR